MAATTSQDQTADAAPSPFLKQIGHLGLVVVVTLGFALANWLLLEFTPPGRWLQFETFTFLHSLIPPFEPEPLPVVVIDIHDLASRNGLPTNRKELQRLVDTIADYEPACIGLDIDFSPQGDQPPPPEDQQFFQFCHELANRTNRPKVPVFLGIYRTQFAPPDNWIDYPEYNDVAASIGVQFGDTRKMARWTTGPRYGQNVYLRSLPEALAEAYIATFGKALPGPRRSTRLVEVMRSNPVDAKEPLHRSSAPMVGSASTAQVNQANVKPSQPPVTATAHEVGGEEDAVEQPNLSDFQYGSSLVNYSKLEELRRETLPCCLTKGNTFLRNRLHNKIVLLGDTVIEDTFTVPGPVEPQRGIYLNASAAYTFARRPLYEFRGNVRFWLDCLLSIILTFVLSHLGALASTDEHRRHVRRHLGVLVLVFASGWALIRFASILWLDFIAIIVALGLHPYVHPYAESRFHRLGEALRDAATSLHRQREALRDAVTNFRERQKARRDARHDPPAPPTAQPDAPVESKKETP